MSPINTTSCNTRPSPCFKFALPVLYTWLYNIHQMVVPLPTAAAQSTWHESLRVKWWWISLRTNQATFVGAESSLATWGLWGLHPVTVISVKKQLLIGQGRSIQFIGYSNPLFLHSFLFFTFLEVFPRLLATILGYEKEDLLCFRYWLGDCWEPR